MTAIEKVLLRKDISSIIVAIIVATAVVQLFSMVTTPAAYDLVTDQPSFGGNPEGSGGVFKNMYAPAIVAFVLQVLALEALLRAVIFGRQLSYNKGNVKKKK